MKNILACLLFLILFSCVKNGTKTIQSSTKNIQKVATNDSLISIRINQIFNNGMPILLPRAKNILGDRLTIDTAIKQLDFDRYIWILNDSVKLQFEDINYNDKVIELDKLYFSSKYIVRHPLGISVNKSNLSECKSIFSGLKKANGKQTFKLLKNKTWYFLVFNNKNILTEIKSSGWDTDLSS